MAKKSKLKRSKPSRNELVAIPGASEFSTVFQLIEAARARAVAAVNSELIALYWRIGKHISMRVEEAQWGKGTVRNLAIAIQRQFQGISGYSAQNLWRMRQFFEVYPEPSILSTQLRELSWSHNMAILSRCKIQDEREFYLKMALREKWTFRELQRQLSSSLFERTVLSPPKLAPAVREIHPQAEAVFKDAYLIEFLDLPVVHSEADLHKGLIENLKKFLIELGRDFCFVGASSHCR